MGDEADALNDMYGWDDIIREEQRERDIEVFRKARSLNRRIDARIAKALKNPYSPKAKPRGKMVIVKCKNCRSEFRARVADRKRGWARFCSKSCKAQEQHKRKGRQYYD